MGSPVTRAQLPNFAQKRKNCGNARVAGQWAEFAPRCGFGPNQPARIVAGFSPVCTLAMGVPQRFLRHKCGEFIDFHSANPANSSGAEKSINAFLLYLRVGETDSIKQQTRTLRDKHPKWYNNCVQFTISVRIQLPETMNEVP